MVDFFPVLRMFRLLTPFASPPLRIAGTEMTKEKQNHEDRLRG
jgi:hypothetical protein